MRLLATLPYLSVTIIPSLVIDAHTVSAQGQVTCFAPDGVTVADNETYVPCNKLGITQQGVHSSCCRLDGAAQDRDLCASTGLCINDGIVKRGYCTDKTWKSPACVNVCTDPKWGGSWTGSAEMTSCTDGSYCCGHNNLTCCGTQWAVKVPLLTTGTISTTTVTATPSPIVRSNMAVSAGLGGALGLVVLVSAGLIFYLLRNIRKLKGELGKREDMLERAHLASGGIGTGGLHSPQFGVASLSPLAAGLVTGNSTTSTTPWTATTAGGDPYGNFKGLYDTPSGHPAMAPHATGAGGQMRSSLMEMELSPPRSELDATGGLMGASSPPAQGFASVRV
ncbi:hypothetical protein V8F20_005374 [Naviculisporaceae sp. PSN 640]